MSNKPKDLTGRKFHRWTVRAYLGKSYWLCLCECGAERRLFTGNLTSGKSRSCGCLRAEVVSKTSRRHGLSKTAEYKVWAGIKRRCLNPNDASFPAYGGSGVTVCDRWASSFEAFLADVGSRPSASHTIERADNAKGYEPGNCRWASRTEQNRNKGNNRVVEFRGVRRTVSEWAALVGVGASTLQWRLAHGWAADDALTTPARRGRNQFS
jgi:hypothetical protein